MVKIELQSFRRIKHAAKMEWCKFIIEKLLVGLGMGWGAGGVERTFFLSHTHTHTHTHTLVTRASYNVK